MTVYWPVVASRESFWGVPLRREGKEVWAAIISELEENSQLMRSWSAKPAALLAVKPTKPWLPMKLVRSRVSDKIGSLGWGSEVATKTSSKFDAPSYSIQVLIKSPFLKLKLGIAVTKEFPEPLVLMPIWLSLGSIPRLLKISNSTPTLLPSCSKITYGKLVRRFVATGSNLGDFPAGRE